LPSAVLAEPADVLLGTLAVLQTGAEAAEAAQSEGAMLSSLSNSSKVIDAG